jgi:dolichol-phosphate mannosyltransferase
MARTLICIPTYNEAENIESLIRKVHEFIPDSVAVLVVDDGSPDGTGAIADRLSKDEALRVHVIHRSGKLGFGTAYTTAFRWAFENGFDQVIQMDADFSHDPKYLPRMVELLNHYDVVIGSRYVPGGGTLNWGMGRKVLSRGGGIYARAILGAPIQDFTGGFNGWRKSVIDSVGLQSLKSDGYSYQIELKYRSYLRGFRIVEFPIIFADRTVGQSKMSRRIILEALRRVWSFRFSSAAFRGERQIPPACAPSQAVVQ